MTAKYKDLYEEKYAISWQNVIISIIIIFPVIKIAYLLVIFIFVSLSLLLVWCCFRSIS